MLICKYISWNFFVVVFKMSVNILFPVIQLGFCFMEDQFLLQGDGRKNKDPVIS